MTTRILPDIKSFEIEAFETVRRGKAGAMVRRMTVYEHNDVLIGAFVISRFYPYDSHTGWKPTLRKATKAEIAAHTAFCG